MRPEARSHEERSILRTKPAPGFCHTPPVDDGRMTASPRRHADGAGQRKNLRPAVLAALWTVSNGRCYALGMSACHGLPSG
jgi:hypothetical protein